MLQCVKDISESAKEIRSYTLKGCWKKLLPLSPVDMEEPPVTVQEQVGKIVSVAHAIGGDGFTNLTCEEVMTELIESIDEGLDEEELAELLKSPHDLPDGEEVPPEPTNTFMNLKAVTQLLEKKDELVKMVESDHDVDRRVQFRQGLEGLAAPYADLQRKLREEAKQKKITSFFKTSYNFHLLTYICTYY
ncbi:hypothetical protein GE061_019798 [Apolygus lucorum]|uniref:Uncharacterized protein n=1 Tax=Apolygus lucorum TaxID=248454 RepID=A0A6A4JYH3_APOLU|nr:hypothetical protein GE061_019798 [Apolygus lucorum]